MATVKNKKCWVRRVDSIIAAFRSLGPARILALFIGISAVIAMTTYVIQNIQKPGMALLYGGLTAAEASRMTDYLGGQNIPYEIRGDGSVYVPADQVGTLRLSVAGQGMVGSGSGYELFDNQSAFGTSSFVSNLNAKRALEGELARTIGTLPAVQSARVHIVMPKQNLFSREQVVPTAAVALNLGGRSLETDQVRSVALLVASAVPNLSRQNITIIDQRGTLLFDGKEEAGGPAGISKIKHEVEARMESSLTGMLERVVGAGKVAVRVTADVNTDKVSEQAEIYDPTQQVVRSEQTIESSQVSTGAGAGGLTGVAGNTPGGDAASSGGGGGSNENRTETTTNFEIGKTVRNLERQGGEVRKLSVAVLVEGKVEAASAGGQPAYTPLTEAEKTNLRTLVQTAVGFDPARGDRVEIVDMPFSPVAEPEALAEPFMTKDQMINIAQYVVLTLALVVVALFVVRPVLVTLNTAMSAAAPVVISSGPAGGGMVQLGDSGGGGENMVNLSSVQGRVRESAVKKVTEIVDQYPEESLGVVRSWMNSSPSSQNQES
jgi:flagellar M-ring protein FliF